jgi:hypothetical protein
MALAQPAPSPRPPRRWLRALAVLFVAGAAFAGSGAATCAYHALAAREEPAPTQTLRDTTNIVAAVRELATLETVAFHMERVIELREHQQHFMGLVKSEDALLLVAAADVIAGVDLGELRDDDVQVDLDQRSARLVLPQPRVLSARLDNTRTYVHTRSTDALAKRAETLETRARMEAERALREAALEAGILTRARASAVRSVEGLVRSLGFTQIEVLIREE